MTRSAADGAGKTIWVANTADGAHGPVRGPLSDTESGNSKIIILKLRASTYTYTYIRAQSSTQNAN